MAGGPTRPDCYLWQFWAEIAADAEVMAAEMRAADAKRAEAVRLGPSLLRGNDRRL